MFCCNESHFAVLALPYAHFQEIWYSFIAVVQRGIFRLFNVEDFTD